MWQKVSWKSSLLEVWKLSILFHCTDKGISASYHIQDEIPIPIDLFSETMNSHFAVLMWVKRFPTSAVRKYLGSGEKRLWVPGWHHLRTKEGNTMAPIMNFNLLLKRVLKTRRPFMVGGGLCSLTVCSKVSRGACFSEAVESQQQLGTSLVEQNSFCIQRQRKPCCVYCPPPL